VSSEDTNMERLAKALSGRFPEKDAFDLAKILYSSHDRGTISYEAIDIPPELKDELLLLLHQERLLISVRSPSRGGAAWKDRVLSLEYRERYQMPRVVWHLVERTKETGEWNIKYAEEQSLKEVGEKRIGEVAYFLSTLKMVNPDRKVTPEIMREISGELNLALDIHRVIDEFTRCGIMSAPIEASLRSGSAQYEINPCLYWH
jgi:hypothetical protein